MPRTRSRLIAWDYNKRLTLHLLRNDFHLEWQEINDVFLDLYRDIDATDISGALRSQWAERGRRKQNTWIDFLDLVLTPEEVARRDARKNLIGDRIASLATSRDHKPRHVNSLVPSVAQQAPAPGSGQPAMAILRAEGANQNVELASRKRRRVGSDDSSDDETHVAPASQRPRAHRYDQPQVQIPRRALLATPPRTPRNTAKGRAPQGATTPFKQTSGNTVRISPQSLAKTYDDLLPIAEEEAHPLRSRSGLLFRYTDADSEPHDAVKGFTARKYRGVEMFQEPFQNLDWTDVFYHIDPIGKKIGFQSPYVSASDKFWWTARLALKDMDKGVMNGQISVIDAAALDWRGVYHVLPYHRQLKKKCQFTAGAWNYAGTHEFLCWKEIPGRAILSTFSVREMFAFVNGTPSMARTLRMEALAGRGGFLASILPAFKRQNVQITPDVITAVAKLAHFMGLDAFAKPEHLAHLWTDIIQGWGLTLSHKEDEEWVQLAARFARALGDAGDHILPARDSKPLELAFLEGVNWGASKNFHDKYVESRFKNKDAQARLIGLADPTRLVSEEGAPSRSIREGLHRYQHQPANGNRTPSYDHPGTSSLSVRERLRSHRHQPTGRTRAAYNRSGASSRAAAAGKSLREAIGIEGESEGSEFESHDDDDDDEIQFD